MNGEREDPVRLVEDPETGDRFLIYGTDKGISVEARYSGNTLWLTQAQIATVFDRDISVVSRHIANVLDEEELPHEGNLQKVQIAGSAKPVTLYSLDMVISVGYRVSSRQGTLFRRWATEKLVQFATKGFVVDKERLKQPDAVDRVAELRDIIRDIRADEANVYRELRRICAMCQDYDSRSAAWRDFYAQTQAKLMWAVTSHTPSEILVERADAEAPDMGLTTFPSGEVRKQDVTISKNYLSEEEVRELNRLTSILLDIFEDQLDLGKLTMMAEARELLDRQLKSLNRAVLRHGGRVQHAAAKKHAEHQYALFDKKRRRQRYADADAQIAELKKIDNSLGKSRKKKR